MKRLPLVTTKQIANAKSNSFIHQGHINRERLLIKQGRKRTLDTPKRMIERREREGDRERKVEGDI